MRVAKIIKSNTLPNFALRYGNIIKMWELGQFENLFFLFIGVSKKINNRE